MRFRAFAAAALVTLAACADQTGPEPQQPAPAATTPDAPPAATADPAAPPAAPPPVAPACDVSVPRTTPLEVSVLPDAASTPFVNVLSKANKSIRVMVYLMGYGPILDTLLAKAQAGVDVKIILDLSEKSVNQKYMDQLTAAGAKVIWSDPGFTYMHAKTLVVDDVDAVISTGNYSASQMAKERNYAVHDSDPADVDVLVKLFDADFAQQSPDLTCTRLVVSPVNARDRIVDLVKSAKTEIVVESMQLADKDVRTALAERKAAGVAVRVILADPSWVDTNTDAASFLATNGIEARYMKSPNVHVKAIVVDGTSAYAGSENLSYTSLSKNREVGVILGEAANVATMKATFEADWTTATAF
jgi:phosphatidylserine/phosphatidylglycerophosphate/cardiolipin synthase-like enzyme